jgi:hypothetical protein
MHAVSADQQGPGAILRLGDLRHRCAEMDCGRIGTVVIGLADGRSVVRSDHALLAPQNLTLARPKVLKLSRHSWWLCTWHVAVMRQSLFDVLHKKYTMWLKSGLFAQENMDSRQLEISSRWGPSMRIYVVD